MQTRATLLQDENMAEARKQMGIVLHVHSCLCAIDIIVVVISSAPLLNFSLSNRSIYLCVARDGILEECPRRDLN